jgi:hypothetical protein
MMLLLLLVAAAPAPTGRTDDGHPRAAAVSVSIEDGHVSLRDGTSNLIGTVRAPHIADAVRQDDGSLLLLAGSEDGTAALLHISVETTARQERRGEVETSGRLHIRWHRDLGGLRPWKVRLADVDGDGAKELVLGVSKAARFDPVVRNRLFVYAWPDLAPRWLGSRLSLPFEDFAFVDCDGDGKDDLVALELAPNGRRRLMRYQWNGFGFSGEEGDFLEVTPDSNLIAVHPSGFRLQPDSPRGLCPRKDLHP